MNALDKQIWEFLQNTDAPVEPLIEIDVGSLRTCTTVSVPDSVHVYCSYQFLMDRAFSTWQHSVPGDNAGLADFIRLETSILATMRRIGGYPDSNKEGGEFDPNKITTSKISSFDTNKKVKLIADMAGLLWFRALPLSKLARKQFEQVEEKPNLDESREKVEKLLEHLEHTRDRLDTVKDELLERDRKMIALQEEVSALKDTIISIKDSQLESSISAVQTVVQEEMSSYSSALQTAATTMKQTCASALAPTKIRAALSSAAVDRSANLIVYGLAENDDSSDTNKLKELFEHLAEAPVLSEVSRLGRTSDGRVRPVRVVLRSRETARAILGKSAQLRDSETFQSVFISPDRTVEERTERRDLVARLKEKREKEPEKMFRIRRGSVVEISE
eukprot:sb/3465546/